MILLPAMAGGSTPPRSLPVVTSLLDLVGNTPLVELSRISPKASVKIYAKLEGQNPTGSIKDRVAKSMIEAAEASGELAPGRHLLEPTSRQHGSSHWRMVAKLKGYPLTCVMPENATEERKRLLRLYGAEIVLSPGAEGSNGAVRLALETWRSKIPRYFMPFQYANPANPRAHYDGTGAEIAEALDRVDVLVAGLGTGGTLMGAGERLRESFPDIVVAAAEPLPGDPVMGLRSLDDGYVPPILDVSKLDRKMLVSNRESVLAVRALLELEGIFAGVSCGAAVHVARKIAEEMDEGVIVGDPRRRRLEVPFRGLLGGLRRGPRAVHGTHDLVVVPADGARRARRARERRAAERGMRARPVRGRRCARVRAGPQRLPLAVSLRARDRPRRLGRHERPRTRPGSLPLTRVVAPASFTDGRAAHRPLGGTALLDLHRAHRRARRVADRRRHDRGASAGLTAPGPPQQRSALRCGMDGA